MLNWKWKTKNWAWITFKVQVSKKEALIFFSIKQASSSPEKWNWSQLVFFVSHFQFKTMCRQIIESRNKILCKKYRTLFCMNLTFYLYGYIWKYVQRVPTLCGMLDLKKNALCKICVSGTVVGPWLVSSMPFGFPFHLPVLFYNDYIL